MSAEYRTRWAAMAVGHILLLGCGAAPQPSPYLASDDSGYSGARCEGDSTEFFVTDRVADADLQILAREGAIAVRYDGRCNGFKVLKSCRSTVPYVRENQKPAWEVSLRSSSELMARSVSPDRAMRQMDRMTVGLLSSATEFLPGEAITLDDFDGPDCDEATHVITRITRGALVIAPPSAWESDFGGGASALEANSLSYQSGSPRECRSEDAPRGACNNVVSVSLARVAPGSALRLPWPPPRPTTDMVIDKGWLPSTGTPLNDAADRLSRVLASAGYKSDLDWFPIPGGFAVLTQFEGIDERGMRRTDNRPCKWLKPSGIMNNIRQLFLGTTTRCRTTLVLFTDAEWIRDAEPAAEYKAIKAIRGKPSGPSMAGTVNGKHAAHVYVYEFVTLGMNYPHRWEDNASASAHDQVEAIGLLRALETDWKKP